MTTTAPARQPTSAVLAAGTRLGVGMVLGGQFAQQVGAAVATGLFDRVGAVGVVGLRLGVSAVVLLALCRPSLRAVRRAGWPVVVGYGGAVAGMNVLFYESIARLPLGTAVTLEILGPLALSVLASRRWLSVLWAALALAGVVLIGHGGLSDLDAVGVGCALGAGALWACYILTAQRSATSLTGLDGLALAMAVGAVAVAPFSLAAAGPALFSPAVLAAGAAVAALSSLLPYALEAISLRRLPSSTFAVLMSLSPAVAAITGAVLLDQPMDALSALAIACVVAACAGAVATSVRRRHPDRQAPGPSARASSLQDRRAVTSWAARGHHRRLAARTAPRPVAERALRPVLCRGHRRPCRSGEVWVDGARVLDTGDDLSLEQAPDCLAARVSGLRPEEAVRQVSPPARSRWARPRRRRR